MHPIFDTAKGIPEIDYDFFNKVFKDVPKEILDTVQIVGISKGRRFVVADEKVDMIRILLSGKVKVMEEYLTGDIYAFSRFYPPEVFGEMEALGGIDSFLASLETEEDSMFATLPINSYLEILKKNSELLMERIRIILRRSSYEQRDNRLYLKIDAQARIKIYFIKYYRQNQNKDLYTFRVTRQEIADETGYSVKTVNRIIKKLEEEKLITLVGQKFQISKNQYLRMLKTITENKSITENPD